MVKDELEVNLDSSESNRNKIKTHELLTSLKNIPNLGSLKKVLTKAHKRTKVLETPLPKNITDKAHRITSYICAKNEVTVWDPIVRRNRQADQLEYPLKQPDYTMRNATAFVKTWKPETDLEKEISELLNSSENNIKDQKLLTPAELKGIQMMSIEELKEKRAEFLKLKAMQQYQETKFKRIKKIKSKRYRKILRKEKLKEEKKELEKLEKENPDAFKEKLAEMEKVRMNERMSLKHKNTSKWAKRQTIYGKYNEKAREEIQQQLDLAKQLTKKLNQNQNEVVKSDEEEKEDIKMKDSVDARKLLADESLSKNPWISFVNFVDEGEKEATNENKDLKEEFSRPKAFVDEKEIENAKRTLEEQSDSDDDEFELQVDRGENLLKIEDSEEEEEAEPKQDEIQVKESKSAKKVKKTKKTKSKKKKAQNDELAIEQMQEEDVQDLAQSQDEKSKDIDPSKMLIAKFDNDEEIDEDENDVVTKGNRLTKDDKHRITLSEAFEDDDVVQEFRMEKVTWCKDLNLKKLNSDFQKRIENEEKVKPIDLTLPGWGDWTGAGIDPNQAKKKNKGKRGKKK